MPRLTDIWRIGIARQPMEEVFRNGALRESNICWLPEMPPFTFVADPFGIWRDGQLFVFVEAFDYRTRLGRIEVLSFNRHLQLLDWQPCIGERWHLSYPFIVEQQGEVFMLPEAHRSGKLTLYRATRFPEQWQVAALIELDCVPVDATPVRYQGRWWLFYSPATSKLSKISHLHAAWAERIEGPWHPHPGNPLRIDRASGRPGGTPIVMDGVLVLPVQDCDSTYGGAVRPLKISRLSPLDFQAEAGEAITAPPAFAPYADGLHTLSACGPVTLFDVKHIDRTLGGWKIDISRKARRLIGRG
jgi:hypothetical protein